MKLALLGYGKMGRAIEAMAMARGHEVLLTIDNDSEWRTKGNALERCDMAIDFSQPTTAVTNILRCFDYGKPVVVGTTGWYDELPAVIERCQQQERALFVASNFSIGMNIMFELNRRLAELMSRCPDYDVAISETHHIHKLDAPSGTAITLANDIITTLGRKESWMLRIPGAEPAPSKLPITAIREGEVAGIHEVVYDSPVDTLTLRHSAKNRQGLAIGAVLAAEFLQHRTGYYTMRDLLAQK